MSIFKKIAKGVGFAALGVLSPGIAAGYLYGRQKTRSTDVESLKGMLNQLLKEAADYMKTDESSEVLTEVQNICLAIIMDNEGRESFVRLAARSGPRAVHLMCAEVVNSKEIQNLTLQKKVDYEEIKAFMITLPQSFLNSVAEIINNLRLESQDKTTLLSLFYDLYLCPTSVLGMINEANNNNEAALSFLKIYVSTDDVKEVFRDAKLDLNIIQKQILSQTSC